MPTLIAIEGLTNSGKTTLAKALQSVLAAGKRDVVLLSDHLSRDHIHQAIRGLTNPPEAVLDHPTETLLYLTHLQRKVSLIQSLSSEESIVIADRLEPSVLALSYVRSPLSHAIATDACRHLSSQLLPFERYGVYMEVSLPRILERADRSPLSRKDLGIDNYYEDFREELTRALERYFPGYQRLSSDTEAPPEDLARRVAKNLG